MKAKLMNGKYYEFVGIYSDDYEFKRPEEMTVKEAKSEAWNTENGLYLTNYENGILKEVEVLVGEKDMLDYPRTIGKEYYEPLPKEMQFAYSMLGRLKSDCDYALNYGKGSLRHLWAGNVKDQIAEMKRRWNEFAEDEKPEWLTIEQIEEYEQRLIALEGE